MNGDFQEEKRARLKFSTLLPNGKLFERPCLNEVFCAEENVSSTSMFRLRVDGEPKGKFKSSGMIVCTGTGSTGWTKFSQRISPAHFGLLKKAIGKPTNPDPELEEEELQLFSQKLSMKNVFPASEDKLFWMIRESYSADPSHFDW